MRNNLIVNTFSIYENNELVAQATSILKKEIRNMSCNCTRCHPVDFGFRRAYTEADGNKLVIYIKDLCPSEIIQGDSLIFAICDCITYPSTKIGNVIVNINGTEFDAIKFGNVKWDQVKPRKPYRIVLGTEEPSATFLTDSCHSKFDYPVYDTTSTTSVEEEATE